MDHVLSSNRGTADPWYFLFTAKYWGCPRKSKIKTSERYLDDQEINSVTQEKLRVIELESKDGPSDGIRLFGIDKIYAKNMYKTKEDIHAVNNLYLDVERKELLALLGHNGAGKSTLIGMLTGILKPTSGNAKICGYDLNEEMDEIRKILGVCPQHDIL